MRCYYCIDIFLIGNSDTNANDFKYLIVVHYVVILIVFLCETSLIK